MHWTLLGRALVYSICNIFYSRVQLFIESESFDTVWPFLESNRLTQCGAPTCSDDMDLRRSIVQRYHDAPTAGHPGELATFVAVSLDYWWPGMRTFICQYVAGCSTCQQFKINRRPTKPTLLPIPSSASRPFAQCSMDFITDLPEINGFNAILSVVDHGLTKGAIFIPCSKSIDSEQTAQLLVDWIFSRFGLSDSFLSDRGPQFASRASKEYLRLLGINSKLSTAFHPQTDGTTERYNQEIEAYLSIYCINNPTEWIKYLPILEYMHNNRRHADRQQTPFELMYGYSPRSFPLTFDKTEFPHLDDRLQSLKRAQQEALAAHEITRL